MRMSLIKTTWAIGLAALVSAGSGLNSTRAQHFEHSSAPGYSLNSVDPSSLGIGAGVKEQAGYLGTPSGDQLFYWYFESQDTPAADPVLIWLNGGPGCSSLEAILFENGPSTISDQGSISSNPWSWNRHANLLYIDNPAGVGYSKGGGVYDSTAAAEDFKNAVRLFWEYNKQELQHNTLHLSGESYAGRYIPVFAEAINKDPDAAIKISSIMIGNGLVNPTAEYNSYQPMLCGQGGYKSVLSSSQCSQMAGQTTRCTQVLEPCVNDGNAYYCELANAECGRLQSYFSSLNPYDIRDSGCAVTGTGLCYPGLDAIQSYFNQQNVKEALGVSTSLSYSVCNDQINIDFSQDNDPLQPTFHNVTNLLESDVPVLVYNGGADIILNWLGGREWTSELQWPGQQGFQTAGKQPQEWVPSGTNTRGLVTNYQNFTFLRVNSAGHMVPHDQPESAYYLSYQWLQGDYGLSQKVSN